MTVPPSVRFRNLERIRIGEVLQNEGLITAEQLKAALEKQKGSGKKLGQVLVELGFLSEQQFLEYLAQFLDIKLIDLAHYPHSPEVSSRLPEAYARRYRAVLLEQGKPTLEPLVGMVDPTDIHAYDQLAHALQRSFRPALVREADLLQMLNLIYRRTHEITLRATAMKEDLPEGDFDLRRLLDMDETAGGDTPVAKLLQSVFQDAIQMNASDLHIEPEDTLLRLRQRVDGVLQEHTLDEKRIATPLVARLKLMAGLDIAEKRLPQDGRFNLRMGGKVVNVRLSTMPVPAGEAVVMRLLDQSASLLSLEMLGMPAGVKEHFSRQIRRPNGMVLVTGPTGSGKTTTLYAALNEINTADQKIITVEDPVEYRLPRITQVQIHHKIGLDFARVLRAALRQDPDIIMVGEMRDNETVSIGIRAAMTGHLVFSTLHTNSALATISRLLDMGAEGYMLATALNAVVSQQLVRRVCDSCATEDPLDEHTRAFLMKMAGERIGGGYRRGTGCLRCHQSGFRGRVGLYEMLVLNDGMADALRRQELQKFAEIARHSEGYRPLLHVGLDYAAAGLTTVAEVIRLAGELDLTEPTAA